MDNMKVIAQSKDAVYLRLPENMQRTIDAGCSCPFCRVNPGKAPKWDTLVVPTTNTNWNSYTFTVHMPDPDSFMQAIKQSLAIEQSMKSMTRKR